MGTPQFVGLMARSPLNLDATHMIVSRFISLFPKSRPLLKEKADRMVAMHCVEATKKFIHRMFFLIYA
jgi:hypothetical protein